MKTTTKNGRYEQFEGLTIEAYLLSLKQFHGLNRPTDDKVKYFAQMVEKRMSITDLKKADAQLKQADSLPNNWGDFWARIRQYAPKKELDANPAPFTCGREYCNSGNVYAVDEKNRAYIFSCPCCVTGMYATWGPEFEGEYTPEPSHSESGTMVNASNLIKDFVKGF